MNAFFSVARMLLWPSLLIKGLWLVLFAMSALFLMSSYPKILLVPLACLMLLVFCIPLQSMSLRFKSTWLLLPHFKQHSRIVLVGTALFFGLLSGCVFLLIQHPFGVGFNLGLLAFAALILPCLRYGHLWPLLLSSAILIVLASSKLLNTLLVTPITSAFIFLPLLNIALIAWFWTRWLTPSQGFTAPQNTFCLDLRAGLFKMTRKPATLSGSLLLGQGDSLQARIIRNIAYCWYLPAFMLFWSVFFMQGVMPEQPFLRALFIFFPGFILIEQLTHLYRRVRRAWLHLPVGRQQLFTLIARQAHTELSIATLIVSPLMFWLLPVKTAIAMLLLWPSLMLFCLYLSWRLITVSLLWTGSALITLQLLSILALIFWSQQPGYLVIIGAFFASAALWLKKYVRVHSYTQDWAQLKMPKAQSAWSRR